MGVAGGCGCGCELVGRHGALQDRGFLLPSLADCAAVALEGLRNAAPADVFGKHGLLGARGLPVLGGQLLQQLNGGDVLLELGLGATLANGVVFRDDKAVRAILRAGARLGD